MHIPDGFIDVQTSAIFAGLAAAGVATALKGARTQLDEKTAPLAGLTAIGLNVFNMGVIGVWAGYGIFLVLRKILPKNKSSITLAAAIGGLLSVPAAAIGFTIQYAMGATATFSVSTVLGAMVGTHILIGIGEAFITGLTVSAVLASRSDLVYGWKNNVQKLEIRNAH